MIERKAASQAWLRDALIDAGLEQKDVSEAWGCDEAVVSRFISAGAPKLTWDRAMTLARLLDMSPDELQARIDGGIAPKRGPKRLAAARAAVGGGGGKDAVAKLKQAVEDARAAMPDATITVKISQKREEEL